MFKVTGLRECLMHIYIYICIHPQYIIGDMVAVPRWGTTTFIMNNNMTTL